MKNNDIPLQAVESSNVSAVGYHAPSQRMAVQFKSGGLYHYHGVPQKTATAVLDAKSVGSAVRAHLVQGGFRFDRLDKEG